MHLVVSTARAAKEAGVKHIAAISGTIAGKTDTIFGRQLAGAEEKVSQLSVPYTFINQITGEQPTEMAV